MWYDWYSARYSVRYRKDAALASRVDALCPLRRELTKNSNKLSDRQTEDVMAGGSVLIGGDNECDL